MSGISVANIHPKLKLYLLCCPSMNLEYRCLPNDGGLRNQNWEDIMYFTIIENRIKEIQTRNKK